MKALHPFRWDPASDEQTDRALHDLLGSAPPPTLHRGFDRRLARAIEADRERPRVSLGVRRVMAIYWTGAVLVSIAILWKLGAPLAAGPGLWLGIGGAVSLAFAALSFVILAPLPIKPRRSAPGR